MAWFNAGLSSAGGGGGGGSSTHNYSTNEQVVGTWIDGSTVYERTFVFESTVNMTTTWVSTPFSITGLAKIIESTLWRIDCLGTIAHDTNVYNPGGTIRLSTRSNNTNLAPGSTLTVRYTKTT